MRREYPTQPIVGVGALVLQEDKLLLVKRGAEPSKGRWSIPGGVLELGERVRDAVVREVKEECNLDIEIAMDRPSDVVDNITMDEKGVKYHFVLLQFLARPRGGVLTPYDDVLDARWVPLEDVEKYDLTRSFLEFFKKHREELREFSSCR